MLFDCTATSGSTNVRPQGGNNFLLHFCFVLSGKRLSMHINILTAVNISMLYFVTLHISLLKLSINLERNFLSHKIEVFRHPVNSFHSYSTIALFPPPKWFMVYQIRSKNMQIGTRLLLVYHRACLTSKDTHTQEKIHLSLPERCCGHIFCLWHEVSFVSFR